MAWVSGSLPWSAIWANSICWARSVLLDGSIAWQEQSKSVTTAISPKRYQRGGGPSVSVGVLRGARFTMRFHSLKGRGGQGGFRGLFFRRIENHRSRRTIHISRVRFVLSRQAASHPQYCHRSP